MLEKGSGGFFPTNPELADILGRTDFDFENLCFLGFLGIGSGDCTQGVERILQ